METETARKKRLISKKKIKEIKRRLRDRDLKYRHIAAACKPQVCEKMVQYVVNGQRKSSNVMGVIDRIAPPLEKTKSAAGNGENST